MPTEDKKPKNPVLKEPASLLKKEKKKSFPQQVEEVEIKTIKSSGFSLKCSVNFMLMFCLCIGHRSCVVNSRFLHIPPLCYRA